MSSHIDTRICSEENESLISSEGTNAIHYSIRTNDSFPTPVEVDTPSHLDDMSGLNSFVPDNMLEQLKKLNISTDSVPNFLPSINTSDLISDDETLLMETPGGGRYSELMVSPNTTVIKNHQSDPRFSSSKSTSIPPPCTGSCQDDQSSSDILGHDASILPAHLTCQDGPLTSSVISRHNCDLPNISLTSISSQVNASNPTKSFVSPQSNS